MVDDWKKRKKRFCLSPSFLLHVLSLSLITMAAAASTVSMRSCDRKARIRTARCARLIEKRGEKNKRKEAGRAQFPLHEI